MSRAVFRLEVARDLYRQMERKTDEKRAKRNFKQRQRRHRAKGKDTNGKSQQMNTLPQDKKLWTRERFNVRCRHPFGILKRSQPCQVCYLNVSQSKTLLKKYESLAARKRQQMLKKHCKYTKYFCKICKHALCMPGIKNNEDTFPSVGRSKLGCFNDFHSIELLTCICLFCIKFYHCHIRTPIQVYDITVCVCIFHFPYISCCILKTMNGKLRLSCRFTSI